MSVCADTEDRGAFWKLSNFLFAQQDDLTVENFQPRTLQFVKDELHLDPEAIKPCLGKGEYEKALLQDEELAKQFSIHETPTVFVNGRRFAGFRSTEDLSERYLKRILQT